MIWAFWKKTCTKNLNLVFTLIILTKGTLLSQRPHYSLPLAWFFFGPCLFIHILPFLLHLLPFLCCLPSRPGGWFGACSLALIQPTTACFSLHAKYPQTYVSGPDLLATAKAQMSTPSRTFALSVLQVLHAQPPPDIWTNYFLWTTTLLAPNPNLVPQLGVQNATRSLFCWPSYVVLHPPHPAPQCLHYHSPQLSLCSHFSASPH